MKKSFLTTLLMLVAGVYVASAQQFKVMDFRCMERDMSAITEKTQKFDQNNMACAILKVRTAHDGFIFDVVNANVVDVKRVGGELWVYVPFGIKKISISHIDIGTTQYTFPVAINPGKVYSMKLVTPSNLNIRRPLYTLVNPDIYPLGYSTVLHDFYLFERADCMKFIGRVNSGDVVEVLATEFHYYKTAKGKVTNVLNDYQFIGLCKGDIFDIFLWAGDDTWIVNYKGQIIYLPFSPDFIERTITTGIYDYSDVFEGTIIENQEDKTAFFKVRTRDGVVGWIKFDSRGLYDGIYNHFEF
jgi:hypothetical protein